ncbi:MAG: NAD(P)/FAD-dependent oxidoreductase [Candidatus Taylorbacteria bacterium]
MKSAQIMKNKPINQDEKLFDLAIIGGGPAGMIAAGRAAELGAKVVLIEKNATLGNKLLMSGGGRCNVLNAEFDTRKLLDRFKGDGKFLFSTFSQFGVKETLDFFHKAGMETKVENEQRVFPISDRSQSVLDVLISYMKKGGVTVMVNAPVADIISEDNKISGIKLKDGKIIHAKSVIIATGGTSHPETGSTGDAYAWLKKIGHTIVTPTPSLVPIAVKDKWVKELSGLTLPDVKVKVFLDGVKQDIAASKFTKKGKILFTHQGLSGPMILNMSKDIGEILRYGEVALSLDILPMYDHAKLNLKLQEIFKENDKKKFKNSLGELLPVAMAQAVVELSGIDPEIICNAVSREERIKLIGLLKDIPVRVDKLLGADKAIVSSGGVVLDEVDFKTMRSRLFSNLYFAGDILNIDRPSGGFSLQICWTTGYVAGTHSAE